MATCKKCGKHGLLLKVNAEGYCETCQQVELAMLRALLTPDQKQAMDLQERIQSLINEINGLQQKKNELSTTNQRLDSEIRSKKEQILTYNEQILLEDFGLYSPRFKYATSDEYKEKIDELRERQKVIIKNGQAILSSNTFVYNGSEAQGRKLLKDMSKLFLRAFNCECDDAMEHVKYNNYDLSLKRIKNSADSIRKLGSMMQMSIAGVYLNLKIDELNLVYEYRQIKQQEKEEQKALREQLREEQKLLKEIEEERKKVEKEKQHYVNALSTINKQLENAPDDADLIARKAELENSIMDADKAIENIDYRVANKRVGNVYIISNVGSFGENIYKIGMTRRLNPEERVDELSDASVPFNFDIHAMIPTNDAPALEAALHKAFADRRVNMMNNRREFFNVTLDEIKEVVHKNYDKTVEFKDIPDAEQYHMTLKLKENHTNI